MELELRDYLRILSKRRWWVLGSLAACLAVAAAFTIRATPVYEAESTLFVGQQQVTSTEVAEGVQVTQLSFQLLESYAEVITSRSVAERAVERSGLPLTPTQLARDLEATPIRDTQVIRLTYRSADPSVAQRAVNGVAEAFVDRIATIDPSETPGDPAVRVSVIDAALRPSNPVSPQPVRNMALAAVLGGMLGVGVAFLVEYLDVTVKEPEDAERITGVPVLASIPRVDTKGEDLHLERDPQSSGSEAFRKLRTAIQFLGVDTPVQTILVTSPFAKEGKTTTALNLAAAYAQAGLRTILVEADLRRPSLHKMFPSDSQRGLTTTLIGRIPLEKVILPTNIKDLSVVPSGALPPNPVELLASEQMASTLRSLRVEADMIVIDAPPILPVADASALSPRVDGVLLVARSGETHRDRLAEAAGQLEKVGGRLLGVVLNVTAKVGRYDGYSYYGYRSAAFEAERAQAPKGGGSRRAASR